MIRATYVMLINFYFNLVIFSVYISLKEPELSIIYLIKTYRYKLYIVRLSDVNAELNNHVVTCGRRPQQLPRLKLGISQCYE